ncbi:MAG TPA: helix-turn-helix transcriptional regulator [Chloroflexota bacterium]|nr:helix-turn-helix transcriptional regulator [Chloroflexota bacterium]
MARQDAETSAEYRDAFGQAVRATRLRLGMTQERLAGKAGLHVTYVGAVERGERNISLENIHALAKGLGVPVRDLFPLD